MAQWLVAEGYSNVAALAGGLPAWEETGRPVVPINLGAAAIVSWKPFDFEASAARRDESGTGALGSDPFLPLLVGQHVFAGHKLPLKREMTVLFVDMVESTPLLWRHSAEEVLALVQVFMEIVVDVAIHHCGDVHDFQGDGALLYFAGPGEAVPAAFRMREALLAKHRETPNLPSARLALDMGPLVIGLVGTPVRQSLSFVGPSINVAARILKLAEPGGIIATEEVLAHARRTDPDLAQQFVALPEQQHLRGVEAGPVTLFVAPNPLPD